MAEGRKVRQVGPKVHGLTAIWCNLTVSPPSMRRIGCNILGRRSIALEPFPVVVED
jgi:hypothetical protein